MAGESEAMKMFHFSLIFLLRGAAPPQGAPARARRAACAALRAGGWVGPDGPYVDDDDGERAGYRR